MIIPTKETIFYRIPISLDYSQECIIQNDPILSTLRNTYPAVIGSKQSWINRFGEKTTDIIQSFESEGFIEFYQNGKQIKWKDIPDGEESTLSNAEFQLLQKLKLDIDKTFQRSKI